MISYKCWSLAASFQTADVLIDIIVKTLQIGGSLVSTMVKSIGSELNC